MSYLYFKWGFMHYINDDPSSKFKCSVRHMYAYKLYIQSVSVSRLQTLISSRARYNKYFCTSKTRIAVYLFLKKYRVYHSSPNFSFITLTIMNIFQRNLQQQNCIHGTLSSLRTVRLISLMNFYITNNLLKNISLPNLQSAAINWRSLF